MAAPFTFGAGFVDRPLTRSLPLGRRRNPVQLISNVFGGPALSALVRKARTKLGAGDFEQAQRIVSKGLETYPGAEALLELELTIRRAQAREGIRSLRARIETDDDPRAYEQIVALYLELGMGAEAKQEAWSYANAHPDLDRPHLMIGEMSLQSFIDGLQARDAHEAYKRLQRAAALNKEAVKPRLLLSELYWCVGADHALRGMSTEIGEFARYDSNLEEVVEQLRSIPEPSGPDIMDGLFERVEVNGELFREPDTWPLHRRSTSSRMDEDRAERALESIIRQGAASELVLLQRNGTVIAHANPGADDDDEDEGGLVDVARIVARTVSRYARDLDLGAFRRCTIESPGGLLAVGEVGGVLAGARWNRGSEAQRLWERITVDLEGALGRGRR